MINAETQTLKLKIAVIAPKSGNSYSPNIYPAGTLPQSLIDKYPDAFEVIDTSLPVEKKEVIEVGQKVIIPTEVVDTAKPQLPEPKTVTKTIRSKSNDVRPLNAAE